MTGKAAAKISQSTSRLNLKLRKVHYNNGPSSQGAPDFQSRGREVDRADSKRVCQMNSGVNFAICILHIQSNGRIEDSIKLVDGSLQFYLPEGSLKSTSTSAILQCTINKDAAHRNC